MTTQASTPSPKSHATQNIRSSGNTFPKYFFAEHKRDELQSFVSEEHPIRPLTKSRFLTLLNIPSDIVPPLDISFSMETFIDIANSLSTFLNSKHFADSTLLIFKSTGRNAPLGHIASTRCRPNVIGAFEEHWTDDDNTLWPCIKIAGKIASVGNLKGLLELLYDLLEVMRYLYVERGILHRDISKGNVLFTKSDTPTALRDGAPTKDIYFMKHLLDERIDAWKTSVLLIDFNRGVVLSGMKDPHGLKTKTGTSLFIARAVELRGPVPFPEDLPVAPIPSPHKIYSQMYPHRLTKFPPTKKSYLEEPSPDCVNRPWHHDLDHDAESVFWLLIHWVMVSQPVGSKEQKIRSSFWEQLIGDYSERNSLLKDFATGGGAAFAHSSFEPLLPLIKRLAAVLAVDRHWIPRDDPRNDPQYVPEAFQRLIFQFVLDNGTETFMTQNVEIKPRPHVTMYSTPTLTVSAYSTGSKRPSRGSTPNRKRRKGKARKRDQTDDESDVQPSESD